MLFVPPSIPFMVPEAEALTDEECLALWGDVENRFYTVLTCQTTGFDVTVYPGQRLMIQNPNGGSSNSLPWKYVQGHGETFATGTYQYESGSYSGIVRIVDPPSIGVSIQNVTTTFSGSQMTVSGDIANSNSYGVKDLYVMWYVTDDAGNEKGTWTNNIPDSPVSDSNEIQDGSYGPSAYPYNDNYNWSNESRHFSYTLCCGNSGMTTATPYIIQAFREDGTPLVNVPIYPGSAEVTQLTINSLEIFKDANGFSRYHVTGDTPPNTSLTVQLAAPPSSSAPGGIYFTWNDQSMGTSGTSYNHNGPIYDPDFASATGLNEETTNHTGIWLIKICAGQPYNMCVEQNFTIYSPADDITPPTFTHFLDYFGNNLEISSSHANPIFEYNITNSSINLALIMRVADNNAGTNDEQLALRESVTCIIGDELEAWNVPVQADLHLLGSIWIYFTENFPADNLTSVRCSVTDVAGNVGSLGFSVNVVLEDAGDVLIGEAEARVAAADNYWTLEYTGDNMPLNIHVYTNDVLFFTGGERISNINIVWPQYIPTGCEQIGNGGTCIIDFSNWSLGQHEYDTNGTVGDGNGDTGEGKFTVFAADGADTTPPTFRNFSSFYSNQQLEISSSHASPLFEYNITNSSINVGFSMQVADNEIDDADPPWHYDIRNAAELALNESVICIIGDELEAWNVPVQANLTVNHGGIKFYENFPADNLTSVRCSVTDASGNVGWMGFAIDVILEGAAVVAISGICYGLSTTGDTLPCEFLDSSNSAALPYVILPAMNSTGNMGYFSVGVEGESSTLPGYENVNLAAACSPSSGSLFPVGLTTVTCTVTNAAGNVGTASFTVTVVLEGAAAEIVIPSWIKNNAGWWASNQIDDRSFVSGLQWLITNGIMNIPPTEQGAGSDDVIPGWIKNNAGWWADGLIDDRNFVTGLQWLITNGIMVIG